MMRLLRHATLGLLLVLSSIVVSAQVATAVPASSGPTSNVAIFYVACEKQGVVNFTGQMQAGYDVYYQLFSGAGGSGTALSGVRRAAVSGAYAFSEVVTYTGGTVAAGAVGSVSVSIARETDPSRSIYSTTVNDLQDGCASPQNPVGASTDLGAAGTTATTPVNTTPILSPFGGELNPGYAPVSPDTVVIGARDFSDPRQKTPGLIFAECNDYPIANPGLIYDTDRVVVFWSWFAKTPEQVQQHIDNAIYEVGYFGSNPFLRPVVRTPIQQRGRNWWVFYYVDLGFVRPGTYPVAYGVRWENPITDGYDDYGPGTANERIDSNCDFTVEPNPSGITPSYTFP
ncbi:MAG: hypothetical protein AELANPGJ_00930 [Anaerolineae bacterium]|nr:hypothetical protein [Anaerolineae bacterium]GIK27395.1 MAG: hypothetical protein BroJett007_05330 [Chloroflexota bacterium]